MAPFRKLSDSELERLSEQELIDHLNEARTRGCQPEIRKTLAYLAWSFEGRIRGWVAMKVPEQDRDDLVQGILISALGSSFDEEQLGQFGAWLRKITFARIADHFRKLERRPKEAPYPGEEQAGQEASRASQRDLAKMAEIDERIEELGETERLKPVVRGVLDARSEQHRRVIELGSSKYLGFEGRPAKEVAAMVNDQFGLSGSDSMSDVNVHKILSRFRADLRDEFPDELKEDSDG